MPGKTLAHALDTAEASIAVAREQLAESFPDAVALLDHADRIALSGTGPSAAVADCTALLLSRVGRPAASINGSTTRDDVDTDQPNTVLPAAWE